LKAIVEHVKEKGIKIDVNAVNNEGKAAIHLIAEGSRGNKEPPLQSFIDLGVKLDVVDNDGNHPIHLAAGPEMLRWLVSKGKLSLFFTQKKRITKYFLF